MFQSLRGYCRRRTIETRKPAYFRPARVFGYHVATILRSSVGIVVLCLEFRLGPAIRSVGLAAMLIFAVVAFAQDLSQSAPQPAGPPAATVPGPNPAPRDDTITLKTVTHYVVLDVVAKNKQGRPLLDLKQNDFKVFERVAWGAKLPQTISGFRLVDKTKPQPKPASPENLIHRAAGAYSNVMAVREPDDPLTVLLFDGMNTNLFAPDTRRALLKMVDSTDIDVPVSVFYLGNNLRMLQDFDSDAKRLRATVHGLLSTGPYHQLRFATVQGPSPAMQQQLGVTFDSSSPLYSIDENRLTNDRIRMTLEALPLFSLHFIVSPGHIKLVRIFHSLQARIMNHFDVSDS